MAFIAAAPLPHFRYKGAVSSQRAKVRVASAALPTPLADRILVRRDGKEQTSGSGLVLTGDTKETNTGTVLKAGAGRYSSFGVQEVMPVKEGDKIFWKDEYGAEEVPGEQDLLLLRAFSVAGVL